MPEKKPWEEYQYAQPVRPSPSPSPSPTLTVPDPLAEAQRREQLMRMLALYGAPANPEKPGQKPGLIGLLMSLMGMK